MQPRILFVDDEPSVRSAFVRRSRRRGWEVDVASGAEDALRLLRAHDYEVLVTDLRMPRVDGLQLIERALVVRPHLGCVIVTGLPDLDLELGYEGHDAIVAVLPKPWDDAVLAEAVGRAQRLHKRRSEASASKKPNRTPLSSVLLVEDSAEDAEVVRRCLRAEDTTCDLEVIPTLETALDYLRARTFDVVLADLTLPDAVDLDAVRRIRRLAPSAPIIVLTGASDDVLGVEAMELGAQDYLTKDDLAPPILLRSIRYAIERKRLEQRLASLARKDPLTGLANRTTLAERLSEELVRAEHAQEHVALLSVELDRFKSVNDTFGHGAGDVVLRDVSTRLVEAVRDFDVVARLGGDEFAVLLLDVETPDTARAVAEQILDGLAPPIPVGDAIVPVSASVGVACSPEAGTTPEELLKSASFAMRVAKKSGGGTFRMFDEIDDPRSFRRIQLLSELRQSIEQDRFVLHYQPQFSIATNQPVGAEALLRWRRSNGTLVPPGDFIPLLEESGLIVDVGAWVIRTACARLREWRDDGATWMRVAINLSPKQFESDGLVATVESAIAAAGVPASCVELEITESLLMRDTDRTTKTLSELEGLGVRIALDDFGTGYSSLGYLERFDVDVLKIDRSFITPLGTETDGRSIAAAIISLGHRLGLEVVAEGVETVRQLERLRAEGCDVVQGFLLGRPAEGWAPRAIHAA